MAMRGQGAVAEYVGWEEVMVRREKGRREIHYTLKRRDGGKDLAVIAKEKSLRHMTYRFLIDDFTPSFYKPRSRRDVLDWLNSFVPDTTAPVSPQISGTLSDGNENDLVDVEAMKETQLRKLGYFTREFVWLGSPSICKKRRKHYQAFRRNGVKISVNEFVHVLAEEDNRLVAHLDDMYEDSKGYKMVVVRWFHKIDEVDIDFPHNFYDREIFFSLCLQDLNIECIDGLAMVLSPQHYAKYLSEARHTQLEPYVCRQQYDNDELSPLDITQVKGYWKQDIVKYMLCVSTSRAFQKMQTPIDSRKMEDNSDFSGMKPRKRLRLFRDYGVDLQCSALKDTDDVIGQSGLGLSQCPLAAVPSKCTHLEASAQFPSLGLVVEVLSQDSGMRGCWFRATVIKKRNNKLKLRYHDIMDAEDESKCLEEWTVASRIAFGDEMGLRLDGRTTIRPPLLSHSRKVSWAFNVGTIVDAWQHGGWWEGIVIQKKFDGQIRVYFPGEKREALFGRTNLRHSQEWVDNSWEELSEKPAVAASILCDLVRGEKAGNCGNEEPVQTLAYDAKLFGCSDGEKIRYCGGHDSASTLLVDSSGTKDNGRTVIDLAKDDFLSQLKWNSSGKRKRSRFSIQRLQPRGSIRVTSERTVVHGSSREFLVPTTLKVEKDICKTVKVDCDNCKYTSDSPFGSSVVVKPLTSLVLSR